MLFDDLLNRELKVHSQNGEDGVLEMIFAEIGVTNKFFVEFGCGDATECNAAYLLEQGWHGLMMDGVGVSRNQRATVRREFITAENINFLFQKYEIPDVFDLLSVDIDGNDFWVWQAITHRPRVVVIEYNAHVLPGEKKSIIYNPNFCWNGSDYFGASISAMKELGEQKGYHLVYCEHTGTNAFFIAADALPSLFTPRPLEDIYRPPNYMNGGHGHPHDSLLTMIDPNNRTHYSS